ncbi:NAD-dependent epimerase/dehydratase [Thermosinus carboxydivorans Nor1]|uniref:NAD-dependent epimerase/dehydratase n=1 Tax=Thermosinus carboxydivorans Nor1 TaxID=401526 RepID=A1HMB7_9FIRM|nr:NAD-dependent epimerase/dehydratase family protein [Thermosinus carboxydivorans]EAX48961.1 NAD-dependent epimerase/dehydratase [Thermosinus carboxydivorans Nor1]
MKILVTGGAGFIGSHTVDKLIHEGCQVTVVDDLSTGRRENVNAQATFIEMDVCSPVLFELFANVKFDGVVHLAAQTSVPVSMDKPDFDCRVNVLGTVNVLEVCRRFGVRRVVLASSAAVYGDGVAVPVREDAKMAPASVYGLSKLTAETYLSMYTRLFGLEGVVLRYANVYGERQGDGGEGGVVSIFTSRMARGEALTVYGDGYQTRDFVYAGDVANANWLALITPDVNGVFNVGTASETSVNDLIQLLTDVAGRTVDIQYCTPRHGDIYRSALDNRLAREKLCWQPQIPLREGLARTWDWIGQIQS